MRLTPALDDSQHAVELSGTFENPDASRAFRLVMSPREWREVHALAKFAQTGLAYDCEASYVAQVFTYLLSEPEEIQSDKGTQAAFSAVDRMAAETSAGGRNSGDVTLALPKEEMRQLLLVLNIAADAEKQADRLWHAAHEEFPYPFPDIEVASRHYAQAFDDLLMALHENRPLIVT